MNMTEEARAGLLCALIWSIGYWSCVTAPRPLPVAPLAPVAADASVPDAGSCPARYERTIFREDRLWTEYELEFVRIPDCGIEAKIQAACSEERGFKEPEEHTHCVDFFRALDAHKYGLPYATSVLPTDGGA